MSGHSKWNNIKHKKEKTDAAKAKVFTKIGKDISVAVKAGGPDPQSNSKLRELISMAKQMNVPNANIERIIKKASDDDSANYDTIYYEGYGPAGVAIIVETMTDNRNRTAGDIRHFFDKYGGNMGSNGCVSFLFDDKGVIAVNPESVSDEDALMELALEAGATDILRDEEDDVYIVYTETSDLYDIAEQIRGGGYEILSAEEDKIPQTYVTLTNEDDIKMMNLMLDHFNDHDDVQRVYHNWENCDSDEDED